MSVELRVSSECELEAALSRPSVADIECAARLDGDIVVLGAGGKMGASLARLCRRASSEAGSARRVYAVSRSTVEVEGVEFIGCDLLDRRSVEKLPDATNVLFLAGRKFGSSGSPELTWAMNTIAPAIVAEKYARSRIVVFSTGNVYPLRPAQPGIGSTELDPVAPVGEYAMSCLGRERVFEYFANTFGTKCLLFRLNYAVDLRYGVLVDIARRVFDEQPVPLTVPAFNVIWQRDANSCAFRSLEMCASPAGVLNVTGEAVLRVREVAAHFAKRFGKTVRFEGSEGDRALLSDASECHRALGKPEVDEAELIEMVASWIKGGGSMLGKPTRFEVPDGKF